MPQWGEDHDWEAINDCVDIMYEFLGDSADAKEKYGFLRCYWFFSESGIESYRNAYEKCLEKHPHMKRYILNDCDYPEYLIGLVPESECNHEAWWTGKETKRCGVCMKEIPIGEDFKEIN